MALKKCKQCKTSLVDGPDQQRSAESEHFKITASSIPVKICPSGHPGFYWYDLDLGVEYCELLEEDNLYPSQGFFQKAEKCPVCKGAVKEGQGSHTFTLSGAAKERAGAVLYLDIASPFKECTGCGHRMLRARYLPKPLELEFWNVISEALEKDLYNK